MKILEGIYSYRDIFVAVAVAVREVHAEDRQDTSEAAGRRRGSDGAEITSLRCVV